MSHTLIFVMAVLATYRVSHLVVTESGPFDIFARLRQATYNRFYEKAGHWIYEGIVCVYCVSFWMAWLVALLLRSSGFDLPVWFSALAIGGGCVLLHKIMYATG